MSPATATAILALTESHRSLLRARTAALVVFCFIQLARSSARREDIEERLRAEKYAAMRSELNAKLVDRN